MIGETNGPGPSPDELGLKPEKTSLPREDKETGASEIRASGFLRKFLRGGADSERNKKFLEGIDGLSDDEIVKRKGFLAGKGSRSGSPAEIRERLKQAVLGIEQEAGAVQDGLKQEIQGTETKNGPSWREKAWAQLKGASAPEKVWAGLAGVREKLAGAAQSIASKKESFQWFWGELQKRTEKVKVLGQPLPEFLTGAVAGAFVRQGVRTVFTGMGGFIPSLVAGAAAGGSVAGLRRYFTERHDYKEFTKKLTEEVGVSAKEGEKPSISPESLAKKVGELRTQLSAESDPKKREALRDQLRYAQVFLKRQTKESGKDIAEVVKGVFAAQGEGEGGELQEKERLAQEILNEIKKAKAVDLKRLAKAVARGAAVGAFAGVVGGVLADYVSEFIEKAQAAAPPLEVPAGVVPDASPVLVPAETLPPEQVPGVVTPPEEEMIIPEGPTEPETTIPETPETDSPVSPELAALPETVNLESGSNPWDTTAEYLRTALGREPSNGEILFGSKLVAQASGIAVPEWGIEDKIPGQPLRVLATQLRPGFLLNFASLKEAIPAMR